jgi:hypothetical protein
MKHDVTPEMLTMLIAKLRPTGKPTAPVQAPYAKPSQLLKNLLGNSPSETPA